MLPIRKDYLADRDAIRFTYDDPKAGIYAYKELDSFEVVFDRDKGIPVAFLKAPWLMRMGQRIRYPANWSVEFGKP